MQFVASSTSGKTNRQTPCGQRPPASRRDARFAVDAARLGKWSAAAACTVVVTLVAWALTTQGLRAERPAEAEPAVMPSASRESAAVSTDSASAASSKPAGGAQIVASIGGTSSRAVDAAFRIGPSNSGGDATPSSDKASSDKPARDKTSDEKPSHVLVAHEAAVGVAPGPQPFASQPGDYGPPAAPYRASAPPQAYAGYGAVPQYGAAQQYAPVAPYGAAQPYNAQPPYTPGQPPYAVAPSQAGPPYDARPQGAGGFGPPPAGDEDLRAPARPPVKEEEGYKPWFAPADGQANTPVNIAPRAPVASSGRMAPPAAHVGGPGPVAVTADFPPPNRGPVNTAPPGSNAGRRQWGAPTTGVIREAAPGVADRRLPAAVNVGPPRGAPGSVFAPNIPVYDPPQGRVSSDLAAQTPVDPRFAVPADSRANVARPRGAPQFDEMFREPNAPPQPYAAQWPPRGVASPNASSAAVTPPDGAPMDQRPMAPRGSYAAPAEPVYPETPYAASPTAFGQVHPGLAGSPSNFAGPRPREMPGENAAISRAVSVLTRPGPRRSVAPTPRPPAIEPVGEATQPGPEREPNVPASALAHDRPRFAAPTPVEMRMGAAEMSAPPVRGAVWSPQHDAPIASIVARSPDAATESSNVAPGPVAEGPPQFRVAIDGGRAQMVAPGPGPQIDFVGPNRQVHDPQEVSPLASPEPPPQVAATEPARSREPVDDSDPPEPEGEAVIASDDPPMDERLPPRETAQVRGPALDAAGRGVPAPARSYAPPVDNDARASAYVPPVASRRDSRAAQAPLGYPIAPAPAYGWQTPATARSATNVDPSWRR